jgi:hypothetical protein
MPKIESKYDPIFHGYIMEDTYGCLSPEDSKQWMKMFYWSEKYVSKNFCDRLQYIRNCGSKLVRNAKYGYIIRPVLGVYGWKSKAVYEQNRKILVPYQRLIVLMLKKLREIYP